MLPLTLRVNGLQQMATALVDSGTDVNVLPWSVGASLGFVWQPNKATIRVAGISQGAAIAGASRIIAGPSAMPT